MYSKNQTFFWNILMDDLRKVYKLFTILHYSTEERFVLKLAIKFRYSSISKMDVYVKKSQIRDETS